MKIYRYSLNLATLFIAITPFLPALATQSPITNLQPKFYLAQTKQNSQARQLLEKGKQAYETGKIEEAIASWQQALRLYQKTKDKQGEGLALSGLGLAYQQTGKYQAGIDSYQTALAIWEELKNSPGKAEALRGLGNIHYILGNYQKAIVFQQQSLEIEIFLKNDARAAYSYNTLGAIYAHLGNYERAITQYEQAIAKSSQNNLLKGQIYHNLAAVYHQNRNFRQAINYYQQAEKIAQQINNSSLEGTAIAGIGLAYATAGNYNQAIPYQKRSIELARQTGDRKLEATALSNLSYTLWQTKKYSEAEKNLESALDILESLRLGLSDLDQVSLADTQFRSYDLLKRVLIAQNQPEKALEIAERGRSQAFIRLLSGRSINQRNLQSKPKNQAKLTANFTFQPREKLNFKKQSKQKEFDKSRSIISNNLNSSLLTPHSEFKLIASTWGNPQPNRNNQVKPINRSQRNSSSSSESISINEIRQVAQQQNATLVEYALLPDADFIGQGKQTGKYTEIYIWVVKPTGEINFRRTKLQPEDFNLQGAQEITRDQATLQKLHQLLIEPIADLLPSKPTEKIILIPHREIFLVPFPALQDSQANYLIQRHTILTSPAIKVLQLTQKNQTSNPDNNNYLIIGNPTNPVTVSTPAENPYRLDLVPLPGAEAEAKAIAQILQTQALIGDDATETKVKQLISSANLVHIAAHGLLDDFFSTGLPGAIILAADSQNDGALTSDEILELDIKADLVIISACDTGKGNLTGDGVIGLSRSLIAAGTSTLIVTLWAIPDQPTSELMQEFYQGRYQNLDKAQALRQAMLKTLEKYPEPENWAAFTLIGSAE